MKIRGWILSIAIVILSTQNGISQLALPHWWGVDGPVHSIQTDSLYTYLGGNFSYAGPANPNGAVLSELNGILPPQFPSINGPVSAAIPDGSGGWFIGGGFYIVGKMYCPHLAHIKSDFQVDTLFRPNPNDVVEILVPDGSGGFYAAGSFSRIFNIPVGGLVHIKNDLQLNPGWSPFIDGTIKTLASNSTHVYAGGNFYGTSQYSPYLAVLNPANAMSETSSLRFDGPVLTSIPDGSGGWFVGGQFNEINGKAISSFAHILPDKRIDTTMIYNINGPVRAIEADGAGGLFVGGSFTLVNGKSHKGLVHILVNKKVDHNWQPSINEVNTLVRTNDTLYAGGYFQSVGISSGNNLFFQSKSGTPNDGWPDIIGEINVVIPDGTGGWFLGGQSLSVNGKVMPNVIHIHPNKTLDTVWRPNITFKVNTMVKNGNDLYVGGKSTIYEGMGPPILVRIDIAQGLRDFNWEPFQNYGGNGSVNSLIIDGTSLIVGGEFYQIYGIMKSNIAKIDLVSRNLVNTWIVHVNNTINQLQVKGQNLYIAGGFDTVNFQFTPGLAKIHLNGNTFPGWSSPILYGEVQSFSFIGNKLVAGGLFTTSGTENTVICDTVNGSFAGGLPVFNTYYDEVYSLAIADTFIYICGSNGNSPGDYAARVGISQLQRDDKWFPAFNSLVKELGKLDTLLCFSGNFSSYFNQPIHNLVRFKLSTGKADTAYRPNPNDVVNCLVFDNSNIYAGGSFSFFDGFPISRLARVKRNNSFTDASLNTSFDGQILSLALSDTNIYVGGSFSNVSSNAISHLVRIGQKLGIPDLSWLPNPDGVIYNIAIADTNVFAGGNFYFAGGSSRIGLVKLGKKSGLADPAFNAGITGVSPVIKDLDLYGGKLFAWGEFLQVNSSNLSHLLRLSKVNGVPDYSWQPSPDMSVNSICLDNNYLYAGGDFYTLGGNSIPLLGRVNLATGVSDMGWMPSPDQNIQKLALSGNNLFVQGNFTTIGGSPRNKIAKLDKNTGILSTSWNPQANNIVESLDEYNGKIYITGPFDTVAGVRVGHLARLDSTNGSPDATWKPIGRGNIKFIAGSAGNLFTGGSFSSVGGIEVRNLVKMDNKTGKALPGWVPFVDGPVNTLFLEGVNLYVGGDFQNVNMQMHRRLARINAGTGIPDPGWSPAANLSVKKIVSRGPHVYISGEFDTLSGFQKPKLARLNNTNGMPDPVWSPFPQGPVLDFFMNDTALIAAGDFSGIGGISRKYVAMLNLSNGQAISSWNVYPNMPVHTITANSTHAFIGGLFDTVNTKGLPYIAKINLVGGQVDTSFYPAPNGRIYKTKLRGNNLYVGGDITFIGGVPTHTVGLVNTNTGTGIALPYGSYDVNLAYDITYNKSLGFLSGTYYDYVQYMTKPFFQAYTLPPLQQDFNISLVKKTDTSLTVNWNKGDGQRRVVWINKTGFPTGFMVEDHTTYIADSVFHGNTNFLYHGQCVYNGTGNSVTIRGLLPKTSYIIRVFGYNGGPGEEGYLIDTTAFNPFIAQTAPPKAMLNFPPIPAQTYGTVRLKLTATGSSSQPVKYISKNPSLGIISNDSLYIKNAGNLIIQAFQPGDSNFSASDTISQNLIINKAILTVTGKDTTCIYGDPIPSLKLLFSGFKFTDDASVIDTLPVALTSAVPYSNAGVYPINPSGGKDNNYQFVFVAGNLSIQKAVLTAKAENKQKPYLEPLPPFTIFYTGFRGTDTITALDVLPTASTVALQNSPLGNYSIVVSGGTDNNYSIQPLDGTLTITKGNQTVNLPGIGSKMYGNVPFKLPATATSGLPVKYFSSNISLLEIIKDTAIIRRSGTVQIFAYQSGDTNFLPSDTVSQSITINKASLTITAKDTSKIYGELLPSFSLLISGFVNNDNISVLDTLPQVVTTASQFSNSGNYPLTLMGGGDNNYLYNRVPGQLQIIKAQLVVQAENKTKTYTTPNPALTLAYSGFKGADKESDLDVLPIATTTALPESLPGTYPINISGGNDNNYSFQFLSGSLTITKGIQTIQFEIPGFAKEGDLPVALIGTSNSGLPLRYQSSDTNKAAVRNNTLYFKSSGTCTITAIQAGNTNWLPATPVNRVLMIVANQNPSNGVVKGNVFIDTDLPVSSGIIYLYQDVPAGKAPLIDSAFLYDGKFYFSKLAHLNYFLLVKPDTVKYKRAIDTYLGNSAQWSASQVLTLSSADTLKDVTIEVIRLPELNGNAEISGTIEENAGVKSKRIEKTGKQITGRPVKGATVVLVGRNKSTPNIIDRTFTDENGIYKFLNIPVGSYDILVDIPGLEMTSYYSVEVTVEDTVFSNLNYAISENDITWKADQFEARLVVYPNPVYSVLRVNQPQLFHTSVMMLLDLQGKVLIQKNLKPSKPGKIELDLSTYPAGTYLLIIRNQKQYFNCLVYKN